MNAVDKDLGWFPLPPSSKARLETVVLHTLFHEYRQQFELIKCPNSYHRSVANVGQILFDEKQHMVTQSKIRTVSGWRWTHMGCNDPRNPIGLRNDHFAPNPSYLNQASISKARANYAPDGVGAQAMIHEDTRSLYSVEGHTILLRAIIS
ncbi:hypothetical protein K438DRAFT_1779807 [Mycena galopus ATCC 62051]|nr:hypothetical protein K438DRAFT_1779807 [Mycena galopus ATCC 62051]